MLDPRVQMSRMTEGGARTSAVPLIRGIEPVLSLSKGGLSDKGGEGERERHHPHLYPLPSREREKYTRQRPWIPDRGRE